MSSRASASRYARALFEVSLAETDPQRTERELAEIVSVLDGHAELKKALASPGVPATGKRGVLESLANRVGVSAPVRKLLLLLADRDRLELLPEVLAIVRELRQARDGVVQAELTTAEPLDQAQIAALQSRLSQATHREVIVQTRVDPAIIGGLVTRIGSTVYDGSVAAQLARIRGRLLQQG